jgi:P63C domain
MAMITTLPASILTVPIKKACKQDYVWYDTPMLAEESIQSMGGKARAEALSADERQDIAKKAAEAKWSLPKVGWEGLLTIGPISMKCGVIPSKKSGESPVRVVSETEFMKALGMYRSGALSVRREVSESGAQIPLSLAYKNLRPFILTHLGDVHFQPMKVIFSKGTVGHGLDAKIIPKICEVWLDARKAKVLGERQKAIAEMAEIILRGLAHVGIVALVDEATGYQQFRDRLELQKILDKYLTDEWARWTRRFPDEFYRHLFRLKSMDYPPLAGKNKPSYVGHWTNDVVYSRLAPGILNKLRELNPRKGAYRARKHHQYLTKDIGVPELEEHLSNVIFLMRTCNSWNEFKERLDLASPKFGETMLLPMPA